MILYFLFGYCIIVFAYKGSGHECKLRCEYTDYACFDLLALLFVRKLFITLITIYRTIISGMPTKRSVINKSNDRSKNTKRISFPFQPNDLNLKENMGISETSNADIITASIISK